MFKFAEEASRETVAIVKGGPWNNRFIDLVDVDEIEEDSPESELFEGLNCPLGSEFMPFPCQKSEQRDVIYITGASGTGKSTFAGAYGDLFQKVFTLPPTAEEKKEDKNAEDHIAKIIIVSPDDPKRDPAFTGLTYVWMSPQDIREQGITLEDMEDPEFRYIYEEKVRGKMVEKIQPMLIIFDDVEALSDKKESEALTRFMQAVLERARKKQIFTAFISHRASSGLATKIILQELNSIWFPISGGGTKNLSYTLKYHINIPDELRLTLAKEPKEFGRWAFIKSDSAPRYAITSKKMFIINEDKIKAAASLSKSALKRQTLHK